MLPTEGAAFQARLSRTASAVSDSFEHMVSQRSHGGSRGTDSSSSSSGNFSKPVISLENTNDLDDFMAGGSDTSRDGSGIRDGGTERDIEDDPTAIQRDSYVSPSPLTTLHPPPTVDVAAGDGRGGDVAGQSTGALTSVENGCEVATAGGIGSQAEQQAACDKPSGAEPQNVGWQSALSEVGNLSTATHSAPNVTLLKAYRTEMPSDSSGPSLLRPTVRKLLPRHLFLFDIGGGVILDWEK